MISILGIAIVSFINISNKKKQEVCEWACKKATTNTRTTPKKESDIKINTSVVPSDLLEKIKGKDKNIIVKQDNTTIIINGKDIENIDDNLDLSVEIENIKESFLKNKKCYDSNEGLLLKFKNSNKLPTKILIEIDITDKVKRNITTKNINLYNYSNERYYLVAKEVFAYNNKITFYIDKLGYYILTNEDLKNTCIKVDESNILKENNKLVDKIDHIKYIILIIIIIIIITLGIIGYIKYKKDNIKKRNDI